MSGCSTSQHEVSIPFSEKLAFENQRFESFVGKIQKNSEFKGTPKQSIETYLKKFIQNLSSNQSELKKYEPEIFIMSKKSGYRLRSVPANRYYFSIEGLKNLEYENELAAAISIEIGHQLLGHYGKFKKLEQFSVPSDFKMTTKQIKAAIRKAALVMYRNGFDLRGIPHYWESQFKAKVKLGLTEVILRDLVDYSYREISKLIPLRNPIIKTEAFLIFQKELGAME